MRLRKIIRRTNRLVTSKVPSMKLGRIVACESRAEKHYVYRLDLDPTVLTFTEQPAEIQYPLDGVLHSHFPDFLVQRTTGPEFVEVKRAVDAAQPDTATRTTILTAALAAQSIGYRVVTHEEIEAQPGLRNVRRLIRCRTTPVARADADALVAIVDVSGTMRLEDLVARGFSREIVLALVANGHLWLDIDAAITPGTLIKRRFTQ